MLNNVRDFGAVGDGITDDRVAIQAAIDNAVKFNRQGGIFFPPGTYRVSKVTFPGGRWSLDLSGAQDFMVVGEGPESVVKLVDTTQKTGDWHVFILRKDKEQKNCQRVVFKDLVVDGNRDGLAEPSEHSSGIEVEAGTEDLVVDRCILRNCFGDGMRLLGESGRNVKRLRIENCLFQTNKRSGLAIQRALEQILITNCIFDRTSKGDQSIDFEPTGADGPTDLIIQGCLINHPNGGKAVSLSGKGSSDPLLRCKFSDNIVLGGRILCTDVRQLTIQNNLVQTRAANGALIGVSRGGDTVIIAGNVLVSEDSSAEGVIALREVNQKDVKRVLVSDNLCFTDSGNGINCASIDDIAIQGNMIVAIGSCNNGVLVHPESGKASPLDNISVRDNDITIEGTGKWGSGICVDTSNGPHISHFSVIGNSVRGAANGIELVGSHFRQTPVIATNRIADDVPSPFVGIEKLPFASVVVGGATSRGGTTENSGAGRFIAGLGDPEGKVPGNVGDIFQRLNGKAGETLYVKETGNGSVTGWKAK